jgi:FkbM family methyltransferase
VKEGEGCGQHGEDRILRLVFRNQACGFLVDVGAADGYWNSNSCILLQRPGWRGVLIEPEPEQFKALAAMYEGRDGVICVECAIGPREGVQTLHCGGQVSTFKEANKESAEVNHGIKYTTAEVRVRNLTKLLDELGIQGEIDFMSIDVEGMNFEVWKTLDKNRYSPKLVCIEGKKYRMYGYKQLCVLGGNTFYLREDLCGPKALRIGL